MTESPQPEAPIPEVGIQSPQSTLACETTSHIIAHLTGASPWTGLSGLCCFLNPGDSQGESTATTPAHLPKTCQHVSRSKCLRPREQAAVRPRTGCLSWLSRMEPPANELALRTRLLQMLSKGVGGVRQTIKDGSVRRSLLLQKGALQKSGSKHPEREIHCFYS